MDMNWLAAEAKTLHQIFTNVFFTLILTFLILGVVIEYFKFPLGDTPQFPQLVGRAFVACILLAVLPEIMNALSMITDAIVADVGKLTEFKHVLGRLGDKIGELSWSWVSVKDTMIVVISYLSFFFLYITVYLTDAYFLFAWMLLFVFSPLLIALFVFPMTAGATRTLFKSLIEVCLWKIVWSCLAALLWSFALSEINKTENEISFLTVIILNIMLAFSILMTPKMTSSFLGGGISNMASSLGNVVMGAAALTPVGIIGKSKALGALAFSKISGGGDPDNSPPSRRQAHEFHRHQRRS